MNDNEMKKCPKCQSPMLEKNDYLPDDMDLKEIKKYLLCSVCMYYEVI